MRDLLTDTKMMWVYFLKSATGRDEPTDESWDAANYDKFKRSGCYLVTRNWAEESMISILDHERRKNAQ